MNPEFISEISIDGIGRPCVTPEAQTLPFIFRAATEAGWDHTGRFLYSPVPREWSYAQWFHAIAAAVAGEYGYVLMVTPRTRWHNIKAVEQAAILSSAVANPESS